MLKTRSTLGPLIAAMGVLLGLQSGCASSQNAGPVDPAVILDKEAHTEARIRAIHDAWGAVDRGEIAHADMRENLKRVAWSRSTFWKVRIAAIDALIADEGEIADTRNMLRLLLPTETHWEVITHVCDIAAARQWTDLAPAIVRSWARPPVVEPPDEKRPERAALAAMFPSQSVEETVYQVFAGEFGDAPLEERDRLAAWGLLCRIDSGEERLTALVSGDTGHSGDPLVEALRAGARDLKCVPRTREQLEWLIRLREGGYAQFWSSATAAVAGLDGEQTQGFALRHISGVLWGQEHRPAWLEANREALLEQLESRLNSIKKHERMQGSQAAAGTRETLRYWSDKLVWGDVLLVLVACEAVSDESMYSDLFYWRDKDHLDTSTEYGGIIDFGEGSAPFRLTAYPPRPTQRSGDNRFTASEDLIVAGTAAIFHFHFHVQHERGSDYAGPSAEDIDYANVHGRSCIVFSSINRDVLNADYYQPNGARIDLGEVRRPGK